MKKNQKTKQILLLSDIHGNLPALEAVLAEVRHAAIDAVWNLGDITGYVPFPVEVIDLLERQHAVSVIGNYDLKVLDFEKHKHAWKGKKRPDKYAAFEWNSRQLTRHARDYLESIPEVTHVRIGGLEVALVHASRGAAGPPITPETPTDHLLELAKEHQADVVLFGHSHIPMFRRTRDKVFINPGSIGIPRDRKPAAHYAILTFSGESVDSDLRCVPYDANRVINAMHAAGRSQTLIDLFRPGEAVEPIPDGVPPQSEQVILDQVLKFASRCRYEQEHTEQVTRLALDVFDGLSELHNMERRRRFQLQCGALLHDVGWLEGTGGHHKTAMRLIMDEQTIGFAPRERCIVALIARYHRKALPKPRHPYWPNLNKEDRSAVEKLAAMLRIADGLDRTHTDAISQIDCSFDSESIIITARASGPANAEREAATRKADLMQRAFGRDVLIEVLSGSDANTDAGRRIRYHQ